MAWLSENWLELLFIVGYLGLLARHCREGKEKTHNLADYLIAGRGLSGWAIALSFYATFVSTNLFIGHAGKSWDVGLIWYVKGLVVVACCYVAWYAVAPRFFTMARAYNSLTLADFLGSRYKSPMLRRLAALVIFGASGLYLIAVYKGSALALQQFLGLEYRFAAVAIFVVVTTYTLAGGFRSVVLTDSAQGLLMAVGSVVLAASVIIRGGGLTAIVETVRVQDPNLVSWEGNLPLAAILGLSIAGGMKLLVDPRQLSRIYGLKDQSALRTARIVSPLLILLTYACLLPLGTFAHALIPADVITDSDQVMPYLLGKTEVLGPVLSSMFLLVLLSAAMSSLDSVLLVAASSLSRDVTISDDQDQRAVRRTRLWVVALSLISMLFALNPFADIVQITAFSGSLYAACFLPTLVLGLYWKRGTSAGALACVFVGSITVIAWYCAKAAGWTTWHEVYVGTAVAFSAYVGVSMLTSNRTSRKCAPAHRVVSSRLSS